jgi:hypothetical protein
MLKKAVFSHFFYLKKIMTGFFLAKGNWLPRNFFSLKETVQKWKMDIVCECGITCVVIFFFTQSLGSLFLFILFTFVAKKEEKVIHKPK